MTDEEKVLEAGRLLQGLLVDTPSAKVKHHLHEAMHHLTVVVLALDAEAQHGTRVAP